MTDTPKHHIIDTQSNNTGTHMDNQIKFKQGLDLNGNSLINVSRKGFHGFSIQSNGNLPLSHNMPVLAHNITLKEVQTHVSLFGTHNQKTIMGVS